MIKNRPTNRKMTPIARFLFFACEDLRNSPVVGCHGQAKYEDHGPNQDDHATAREPISSIYRLASSEQRHPHADHLVTEWTRS
jgi:hypothetical protein